MKHYPLRAVFLSLIMGVMLGYFVSYFSLHHLSQPQISQLEKRPIIAQSVAIEKESHPIQDQPLGRGGRTQ